MTLISSRRRNRAISRRSANGFTLIEMVLALSIFSLILLISYQTLVSSAQAKLRVSDSVEQQGERRSAYRTLANAFGSGAQLKGDKHGVEIDLATADSAWLDGAKKIEFAILDNGVLSATVDNEERASILLRLEQAEFSYRDGTLIHSRWASNQLPKAIELSWNDDGQLQRWRFTTQ